MIQRFKLCKKLWIVGWWIKGGKIFEMGNCRDGVRWVKQIEL